MLILTLINWINQNCDCVYEKLVLWLSLLPQSLSMARWPHLYLPHSQKVSSRAHFFPCENNYESKLTEKGHEVSGTIESSQDKCFCGHFSGALHIGKLGDCLQLQDTRWTLTRVSNGWEFPSAFRVPPSEVDWTIVKSWRRRAQILHVERFRGRRFHDEEATLGHGTGRW